MIYTSGGEGGRQVVQSMMVARESWGEVEEVIGFARSEKAMKEETERQSKGVEERGYWIVFIAKRFSLDRYMYVTYGIKVGPLTVWTPRDGDSNSRDNDREVEWSWVGLVERIDWLMSRL